MKKNYFQPISTQLTQVIKTKTTFSMGETKLYEKTTLQEYLPKGVVSFSNNIYRVLFTNITPKRVHGTPYIDV